MAAEPCSIQGHSGGFLVGGGAGVFGGVAWGLCHYFVYYRYGIVLVGVVAAYVSGGATLGLLRGLFERQCPFA